VEITQVFAIASTQTASVPQKLPATASPLPRLALLGLLSLGLAGSLRLALGKMN